jgi:hypothetical protein
MRDRFPELMRTRENLKRRDSKSKKRDASLEPDKEDDL